MIHPTEISSDIRKCLDDFHILAEKHDEGTLLSVQDGILRISGLSDVKIGETLACPGDLQALALNLEPDFVGAVALGNHHHLKEGDTIRATGRILEVPVGEELLGRVINPMGQPIDAKPLHCPNKSPIERIAPGVITRQSVCEPLQTGIKSIDTMVPIGRGQRELIIGDRQTGKTAIAIDTIINQKHTGVKCIYVAIGQKTSSVAAIIRKLQEHDALTYTIVVAANASDVASLQYIAPFAACSMGEYFRDRGENALIIYDDLTKHAWAYRQISLLLRRPPGREAYPGDVFYLHSRLLERAACVNADYVKAFTKGKIQRSGSLTALPIIETQAGDVSAFVPTNVISITDGQIYLDTNLFNSGIRPAINAGLSVSRVGGAAQTHLIKKLAGGVRLSLAKYTELEAFSQFSSDLDEATRKQLAHGERLRKILKQNQYLPLNVTEMAISLLAVEEGFLDSVDVNEVELFEQTLHKYLHSHHAAFMKELNEHPKLEPNIQQQLHQIITHFKQQSRWAETTE